MLKSVLVGTGIAAFIGFGVGWLISFGARHFFSIDWNGNLVGLLTAIILGCGVFTRAMKNWRDDQRVATPPYSFTQGTIGTRNIGKHWSALSEGERSLALDDYRSAQRWMENGKWSHALGVLNRAVLTYPYFIKAIDDMADCYLNQGDSDKCAECWKTTGAISRLGWEQPAL